MNTLVLGGTYFIGRVLVELLLLNKFSVSILNRGTMKSLHDDVQLIVADRHNHLDIKNGLRGKSFDVVIDLSGYNKDDVAIVLDSLEEEPGQYIFCSSIAVCSQPPVCWPITEEHQKCSSATENEYGYNKWQAEGYLFQYSQKNNRPISIVRPVYVYGPYDYSGRLDYIFERIWEGRPIVMSGNGENIVQFGYVYDLCKAIVALIGNEAAYGQAFNISGRELVTISQLIGLVSSVLGKAADVEFNASISGEASTLTSNHRFADISKAERVLRIVPIMSLSEGIQTTHQWWLANRRRS
ncbi:MAG: NAD-dependent epimerase/dehydratase family protein [bacterium]|nr:NAD-dependent epimerase/dehydratase family protein [bacterium]